MSSSGQQLHMDPADPVADEWRQANLEQLEIALGRLRRLWEQPGVRGWFRQRLDLEEVDAAMYRTLRAVNQLGPDGASVKDVAELLRVDGSTASRFLDRVAAAGYVQRSTSAKDGRRRSYSLTDDGRQRLRSLRDLRVGLLDDLTAGWSKVEIETLNALLDRFDGAVVELELRDGD